MISLVKSNCLPELLFTLFTLPTLTTNTLTRLDQIILKYSDFLDIPLDCVSISSLLHDPKQKHNINMKRLEYLMHSSTQCKSVKEYHID